MSEILSSSCCQPTIVQILMLLKDRCGGKCENTVIHTMSSLQVGAVIEVFKMEMKKIREKQVGILTISTRIGKDIVHGRLMVPE